MGNAQSQQSNGDEQQDMQSCYGACFSRMVKSGMKEKAQQQQQTTHEVSETNDTSKTIIPVAVTDTVDGTINEVRQKCGQLLWLKS